MKRVCKYCGEAKEDWTKKNKSRCRDCINIEKRKFYYKNKEKISIKQKAYYQNTVEKQKEYRKSYYLDNKEEIKQRVSSYYKDNLEERKKYAKDYKEKNREKVREWRRDYSKRNNHVVNAKGARYRAKKVNATPPWSEQDKIAVLYEKAQWLGGLTGLKYHVDHIIPINGVNVCGLHVWSNLQILEEGLNIDKSNHIGYTIKIQDL